MASPPNYNHPYPQQHPQHPPPVQTQNLNMSQRAFSPPSYQQSPVAMSPTVPGIPPAKRQRLSPNPTSPYQSPFATSPYAVTSPYATSPPANNYLSLPQSPAAGHPPPSFHQPQPYQNPHAMVPQPPSQGSMPPPKMPYSKAQDSEQLEKANPRDMDVNNISDVLTGSGIDLRAEEDNLLHNYGSRTYGNSFNSQTSGSTVSPHGSFNNWSQQASHGAYQGTGPLSQSMSQEQQEAELIRKHEQAARVLHETAQQPLSDPFLFANILRHRIAKRAYENGIQVNLDGLFDKIPEQPQDVARTAVGGSNGEAIVGLQAASLLNQNTTFVEILSLLSLAAEERVRTVVEDSFALCQGRQNTSHGIVPPDLLDIAETDKDSRPATATAVNILKTSWEAPDSAVSPMTVSATKQPPNVARLPTPPSEAPPTPQPTVQVTNHVINALKRRVDEDESFEKERIRKRQKRLAGNASTPADTPTVAPLPLPEKMTKKERDRINKLGQTEDVLHRKANETASMALGGKKKYAWMSGGGGGGGGGTSGTSTPRLNTAVGTASGTQTPQHPPTDRALQARKRTFPLNLESSAIGEKIQIRDLVHVLESDGREKKTLTAILARLKNTDKDEKTKEPERRSTVPPTR